MKITIFEKLARHLARWQAKLKHCHAVWHVGTFIGLLARKIEQLAHFLHVGTQACWNVNHIGTQALMAHDLANSCQKSDNSAKVITMNDDIFSNVISTEIKTAIHLSRFPSCVKTAHLVPVPSLPSCVKIVHLIPVPSL